MDSYENWTTEQLIDEANRLEWQLEEEYYYLTPHEYEEWLEQIEVMREEVESRTS